MLVLTRRVNEAIEIGPDIRVMVVDVRKQPDGSWSVRLGIQAPRSVPVHREEVAERDRVLHRVWLTSTQG